MTRNQTRAGLEQIQIHDAFSFRYGNLVAAYLTSPVGPAGVDLGPATAAGAVEFKELDTPLPFAVRARNPDTSIPRLLTAGTLLRGGVQNRIVARSVVIESKVLDIAVLDVEPVRSLVPKPAFLIASPGPISLRADVFGVSPVATLQDCHAELEVFLTRRKVGSPTEDLFAAPDVGPPEEPLLKRSGSRYIVGAVVQGPDFFLAEWTGIYGIVQSLVRASDLACRQESRAAGVRADPPPSSMFQAFDVLRGELLEATPGPAQAGGSEGGFRSDHGSGELFTRGQALAHAVVRGAHGFGAGR